MTTETESKAAFSQPDRGILFVVSGPSGAGKSTLVSAVIQRDPRIRYCPSFTTRPKRPGEVDGRDYYFVSESFFQGLVRANQLLEHATVYGYAYGRSKELIMNAL